MLRLPVNPVPQTYAALRRAVEAAMIKGQRDAEIAKIRTYHETGRLIHEYVLLFKERADYGSKTLPRLAGDLKLDRSVLLRCVQFFRAFPIVAHGRQLNWAHYRLLIPVEDKTRRLQLANEAAKHSWTSPELALRVQTLRLSNRETDAKTEDRAAPPNLLAPKRGTPGICKVIDAGAGPVVDLGFACYLDLPRVSSSAAGSAGDFAVGDLVQQDRAGRLTAAPAATQADRFTYEVDVLKVVDGDTLWVKIYLRPRQWVKQKLRLRDLDCPEMKTTAGQAAKRFVESRLAQTTSVTICTTKPDKYDRYLADVYLETKGGEDVFLNNALLANGHAVRKAAWEFTDWDGG